MAWPTAVPRSACRTRFIKNDYKGYLEDRRPNSQGDPYAIASQILKTVAEVPTAKKSAAA